MLNTKSFLMNHQIKKRSKRPNIYITIIVGSIVFAIFCWLMISYTKIPFVLFGGNMNQDYNGEFVKFSASIIGGGFLFFGLLLNARRTKAVEKQNKLTRKGHVDERFKNAIEHLGSDKDAIVLGGIYALHRIAQENKTYRQPVFDILCSYIRGKTSSLKLWDEITEFERGTIKPTIVIQTIIDLLFKTADSKNYIYMGLKANLNGIRCIHANFSGAHLVNADLINAHMEGAILTDVHLESADMNVIKLDGARLEQVHFEGSSLSYANFEGTYIDQAYFECTKLHKANFEGSSLCEVHFEGAILPRANFKGTSLSKGYFEGSDLFDAHFEGAHGSDVHFEGAKLILAHFEGADLSNVNFEGTNLHKTNFKGAYLSEVHFEGIYSSGPPYTEFPQNLINRIGKESEFINVFDGKFDSESARKITENICTTTNWRTDPSDFVDRMLRAISIETNIEKDAITGILTQEKAEEIIERYNKAMAKVPKR